MLSNSDKMRTDLTFHCKSPPLNEMDVTISSTLLASIKKTYCYGGPCYNNEKCLNAEFLVLAIKDGRIEVHCHHPPSL